MVREDTHGRSDNSSRITASCQQDAGRSEPDGRDKDMAGSYITILDVYPENNRVTYESERNHGDLHKIAEAGPYWVVKVTKKGRPNLYCRLYVFNNYSYALGMTVTKGEVISTIQPGADWRVLVRGFIVRTEKMADEYERLHDAALG